MRFQISFYFNKKLHTLQAETLEYSPGKVMRYKVKGIKGDVVLQKDLSRNNMPWELVEGSFGPGLSSAGRMDLVRSIGAAIDRVGQH